MEQKRKKTQVKQGTPGKSAVPQFIIPALLGVLLFVDPLFIDVQISRPKLLVLELGTFTLAFAFILIFLFSGRMYLNSAKVNLPVAVYALYIGILYAVSGNKAVALSEFKRMLLCSAIFFIAANSVRPGKEGETDRTLILSGFALGSGLAAVYGLMQHWGNILIFSVPQMERVFSTFGNPIFFAAHLVVYLPVALGLFFFLKGKSLPARIFILLLLAAGISALYFTKTRAAWIGFLLSVAVFGIAKIREGKTRIVFLAGLAVGTIIFLVITWNVWLRHQAHPVIWRDTVRMWSDYPIFGTGIGTFHIDFPMYASEQLLKIWPQKERIINDAHNEYVQLLSETGIVGLGIYLWMIYAFFSFGVKQISFLNKNQGNRELSLVAGLTAAATAILAQNFFSVDMRFIISAFYFFMVMGLLFSFNEKRVEITHGLRGLGRVAAVVLAAGVLGIVGLGKNASKNPEINFLQVLHFDLRSAGFSFGPSGEGTGLLPLILKPYVAQKKLAAEVGFFDEKVLEPYKTIAEMELLSSKHPNEPLICEKLAWVYSKEKNFSKAIEYYEKAVKLKPNSFGSYNNLGNISFLLGQRARAIEYYKKSLAINPGQLDAHTNMGIAFYYEGRLGEAAAEFNSVLKLDPSNEKAIVMLKKMRE